MNNFYSCIHIPPVFFEGNVGLSFTTHVELIIRSLIKLNKKRPSPLLWCRSVAELWSSQEFRSLCWGYVIGTISNMVSGTFGKQRTKGMNKGQKWVKLKFLDGGRGRENQPWTGFNMLTLYNTVTLIHIQREGSLKSTALTSLQTFAWGHLLTFPVRKITLSFN